MSRAASLVRWTSGALMLSAVLLLARVLPVQRLLDVGLTRVDDLGPWGPVIFGAVYVAAVLLLVPGSWLTLAIGGVYGVPLGLVVVSVASTTAVALAFLIARYLARDRVRRLVARSPALAAVDEAIGQHGWKIVALLRLSPAVPFNLQNYLYGVTAIRFWPAVLASWVAMLPGTFLYVYLGSLGRSAVSGAEVTPAEWALRAGGLVATVAVTVYVARLARAAITRAARAATPDRGTAGGGARVEPPRWDRLALAASAAAMLFGLAVWATVHQDAARAAIERLLGLPPLAGALEPGGGPAGAGLCHRRATR